MSTKPLLFLDVDGVINCFPAPLFSQLMESQDWRDTLATTQWRTYKIWWQESIVKKLNELHERGLAEIVWLTTWADDARLELAPSLGLADFRVIERGAGSLTPTLDWWKLAALKHELQASGRPFVWIDDQLAPEIADQLAVDFGQQGLLVRPESNPGLTHEELALVEQWLQWEGVNHD